MIVYKITILLDGDVSHVISVSLSSIIDLVEEISSHFDSYIISSNINTQALITRLKDFNETVSDQNTNDSMIVDYAGSFRSHDSMINITSQQSNKIPSNDELKAEDDSNIVPRLDPLDPEVLRPSSSIVDEITQFLNFLSQHPDIITSSSFKTFIQSNPLQNELSETIKSPSITAIDLITQPLDYSLLYIPRAGRQYLDIELMSGQSLIWKFRVENDYDINFGMFVYTSDDSASSSHGIIQIHQNIDDNTHRAKQVMNKLMKKTNGLSNIDLSNDELSDEFGSIRVLEPLTRIKGSAIHKLHQSRENKLLQSSHVTHHGYIEGSYYAEYRISSSTSAEESLNQSHILRLIFDNSVSAITMSGKYIEYIIQVVDENTMIAAKAAADDYTIKLSQPRSVLYENITNSKSIDFNVDGPWIVDPKLVSKGSEDLKALIAVDDYSDGHTMVPGWISALGAIPVAGPIVLTVTDKVAKLPLVSNIARTIDHFLPPTKIESRIAISSTVPSSEVPFVMTSNTAHVDWKIFNDTADASTMTEHYSEPGIVEFVHAPVEDNATEESLVVEESVANPSADLDFHNIQQQLDETKAELADYKKYCEDMRKRLSYMQQDHLSQQKIISYQTEEIKAMQFQQDLHLQSYQTLHHAYSRIKAEKRILRQELLTLQSLGLYESKLSKDTKETRTLSEDVSSQEISIDLSDMANYGNDLYAQKLQSLYMYREQHRALHELLSADENNETLETMANDLNQMIRKLQDELSAVMLHQSR